MEREGRSSVKTALLDHGAEKGTIKHPFPMNYFLKPWKLGQWVYQVIKFGIVQYVSLHCTKIICLFCYKSFHNFLNHVMFNEQPMV